jgi:DNA-binding PadR family transcriptional regulator
MRNIVGKSMIFAWLRDRRASLRGRRERLVVEALSTRSDMTGAEISRETGVGSGSLYPVLIEMERSGRIASRWETDTPRPWGPPRRRFYALADGPGQT